MPRDSACSCGPPKMAQLVRVPNQNGSLFGAVRLCQATSALASVKLAYSMARERATPPLLKDLNERTVLEAIRVAAPISRAEISRRVGISKPTVSLALQSLLQAGLVRVTAHDGDGPS